MTMHPAHLPPRQPPGLEPRVVVLEATAEAHSDALSDMRRERADLGERLFDELAKLHNGQSEIRDGLQSIRTDVQGVNKRVDVVEVRTIAAIDKDRAVTDTKLGEISRRVRDGKRTVDDLRRELGARVDEVEDDVGKSNEHGRDTMDRVAREAQAQEIENLRRLVDDNKAAADKALAEAKAEAEKERAKDVAAVKEQLAKSEMALAKSDDRAHSLKTKVFFLVAVSVIGAVGWVLAFAIPRAIPERSSAPIQIVTQPQSSAR